MRSRSVRLHLDKGRESSATTSTTTESVTSHWNDGEPPEPPLPMSIALRGLMTEAEALHDQVDFADFVDLAESPRLPYLRDGQQQWRRVERSATFSLLKRDDEVLALARLDATVEEVASILGATTDQTHTAAMSGLYGDAFIAGSVAFVQRPEGTANDGAYQQLSVKTCNFVRPDLMSKNEQWCFGELLRRKPDRFTLVQGSLSATQAQSLPARRALNDSTRRVAQLRGVTAAYMVERLQGSHALRIVFHAVHKHERKHAANGGERGSAIDEGVPIVLQNAVRARLLRFARGLSQLSHLVRRRRFGAQRLADRSAFHVNNPRCTCCTRRLSIFLILLPRTRCYLCGYHVCVTCSTSEKMETHNGRLASIMVCSRCLKAVTACDYEHMLTVSPGPVCILPDRVTTSSPRRVGQVRQPSSSLSRVSSTSDNSVVSSTSTSSSQTLVELLGDMVEEDVTTGRRHAAFMVLEQLLSDDQTENQAQVDMNAKLLRAATSTPNHTEAVARALDVEKYPVDLNLCKVACAKTRPYPMLPALVHRDGDSSKQAQPIKYPVPENEDIRLAAIEQFELHDVANVPELNVICTLAAAEMGCPHSVVTLVGREVVTILATNSPENWAVGSGNPREQTFCQHFVMEDRPLLVTHAEADMRFYHIAPVVMRSLRFYAGFPISITNVRKTTANDPDKVIVCALCCLDAKPHQMTRSQYWRLVKLAETASAILERRAVEYLANPEKFTNKTVAASCGKGVAAAC